MCFQLDRWKQSNVNQCASDSHYYWVKAGFVCLWPWCKPVCLCQLEEPDPENREKKRGGKRKALKWTGGDLMPEAAESGSQAGRMEIWDRQARQGGRNTSFTLKRNSWVSNCRAQRTAQALWDPACKCSLCRKRFSVGWKITFNWSTYI